MRKVPMTNPLVSGHVTKGVKPYSFDNTANRPDRFLDDEISRVKNYLDIMGDVITFSVKK